jgi:hypothetical protein
LDTVCHKQLHIGSLFSKEIITDFEGGRITSDGGGLLLREVDQRYHLSECLAACLHDSHVPERIIHELLTSEPILALGRTTAGCQMVVPDPILEL